MENATSTSIETEKSEGLLAQTFFLCTNGRMSQLFCVHSCCRSRCIKTRLKAYFQRVDTILSRCREHVHGFILRNSERGKNKKIVEFDYRKRCESTGALKVSSQTSVMRRYFFSNFEPWSNWKRRIYFTILKILKLLTIYYFIRPAILITRAHCIIIYERTMTQIAKEPPRYRKPPLDIQNDFSIAKFSKRAGKKVSFSVYKKFNRQPFLSLPPPFQLFEKPLPCSTPLSPVTRTAVKYLLAAVCPRKTNRELF